MIVRHVAERWRTSNTGRLAALALGATIVEHGAAGRDAVLEPAPGTVLVFPEGAPTETPPVPASRLLFLDATWHQARRMRQRLAAMRGLPVWHLAIDVVPAARLRESPGAGKVSTIEAIARALRVLEGDAPADALEALFAVHVARGRSSGRR